MIGLWMFWTMFVVGITHDAYIQDQVDKEMKQNFKETPHRFRMGDIKEK